MNFEELYQKVQNGTATPEEKAFVEEKIRKVSAILDDPMDNRPIIHEADNKTIIAARKSFNLRNTLKIIAIVLCVLALLAGGTLWYIFGTAVHSAKTTAVYSREQAVDLAEECVRQYSGNVGEKFVVRDVDRHLDMTDGLRKSVFYYEVDFRVGFTDYEVKVDARSGYAVITDVDYD